MLEVDSNLEWENIKDSLHNEFGDKIYNSWLSKLNFVSYNSNTLCMSVETSFIKEWITKEFLNGKKRKIDGKYVFIEKGIKQILLEKFNIKDIEIIVDDTIKQNTENNNNNNVVSISQHDNVYTIGTELNKLYTFDNYVVGDSNKLAYSVAKSIINNEDLGFDVNPFFLYSEVGLGKTHLMQAMAWEFQEKYKDSKQRDCLRCTPIFHDAIKCGLTESRYTVHEHPLLASDWIKNTRVEHDIDDKTKQYIARLCESHSGQWVSTKRSKVVLPKPETDDQFLVHLCDYLSSRSNLDMTYNKELLQILDLEKEEIPDINTYIIPFGKYKGKTLPKIKETDPGYISWAKENINREPVKTLLAQM